MITKTRTFENALVWTGPKTRALFYEGGGGGKELRISRDMDDRMVGKIKTPKNPYDLKTNPPKKFLDQNLTLKKCHAQFPRQKNFLKALNDTTRKTETYVTECLCLFIHPHTIWSKNVFRIWRSL